jgi:hypothetical protein
LRLVLTTPLPSASRAYYCKHARYIGALAASETTSVYTSV